MKAIRMDEAFGVFMRNYEKVTALVIHLFEKTCEP
jgi:hypothetical protein